MLKFPGKIPITIHPLFWLSSAALGFLYSGQMAGMIFWVGVILFSVLVHELGHALTAVFFGQSAKIDLVALGGLTTYQGKQLSFGKQFLITLNGPLFGFFLFLAASFLLRFSWGVEITMGLKMIQMANLFWTIMNLLPVLPLDGGQLLRIGLEAALGVKGFRISYLVGGILSAALGLIFLAFQWSLLGAIFFLFAFRSFASWRSSWYLKSVDRKEENKDRMVQAEEALLKGNKEEAKRIFEELIESAKGGVLAISAAQFLAFLLYQEGDKEKPYTLLLPIKEHLADDALCLLQSLAEKKEDLKLVAELSSACYETMPSQEVALRNARAFAFLQKGEEAGGWLQTAFQYGGVDFEKILSEEAFLKVAQDPKFQRFVEGFRS